MKIEDHTLDLAGDKTPWRFLTCIKKRTANHHHFITGAIDLVGRKK